MRQRKRIPYAPSTEHEQLKPSIFPFRAMDEQVLEPYVPVDRPKYYTWTAPIWWPVVTLMPALVLPIPLIAMYKDLFTRRPGRVPISLLLIPLWCAL